MLMGRAGLPFWSRFDPEERSGAAWYLEKEEKMTRQVLAGLTENDAQNKKRTLEASEAGEAAISRRERASTN